MSNMAQNKDLGLVSTTQLVVMVQPNLITPWAPKGSTDTPKYSAKFLFAPDNPDLKTLKQTAAQVARAAFPGRELKTLQFPFVNGDTYADEAKAAGKDKEWARGHVIVSSRSKYEPRLAIAEGGPAVDLDGDARGANSAKFYSGVLALVQFNFVAYKGVGRNPDGVTAYLSMVVSTNRGAHIRTGGASAAEVFKNYVGTVSDVDPTGGAKDPDDEIPF
jgi:hypothetical protein